MLTEKDVFELKLVETGFILINNWNTNRPTYGGENARHVCRP